MPKQLRQHAVQWTVFLPCFSPEGGKGKGARKRGKGGIDKVPIQQYLVNAELAGLPGGAGEGDEGALQEALQLAGLPGASLQC